MHGYYALACKVSSVYMTIPTQAGVVISAKVKEMWYDIYLVPYRISHPTFRYLFILGHDWPQQTRGDIAVCVCAVWRSHSCLWHFAAVRYLVIRSSPNVLWKIFTALILWVDRFPSSWRKKDQNIQLEHGRAPLFLWNVIISSCFWPHSSNFQWIWWHG